MNLRLNHFQIEGHSLALLLQIDGKLGRENLRCFWLVLASWVLTAIPYCDRMKESFNIDCMGYGFFVCVRWNFQLRGTQTRAKVGARRLAKCRQNDTKDTKIEKKLWNIRKTGIETEAD
jgi:hypothetical protein